ncbi:MAG: histidinol-phosphatase [Planctomycetota bacterium]
MLSSTDHDGRFAAMIEVALAAGSHTLKYFRQLDLAVEAKSDDSPVTVADREAEQLTRKLLEDRFPMDTLQGEEFATKEGNSTYRWIVDPIDGTKSFVCGVPLYSTLLALECEGRPLGGAIYIPALGEMIVAGVGQGSWHTSKLSRQVDAGTDPSGIDWKRASVSKKTSLDQAVFVTSQVDTYAMRGAGQAYLDLEKECWISRSWGDGYGYLMVATGRAELMVDPECNAWDVAAIQPIIEESGGKFTDWKGKATTRSGDGVGTNGHLHADVLQRLAS